MKTEFLALLSLTFVLTSAGAGPDKPGTECRAAEERTPATTVTLTATNTVIVLEEHAPPSVRFAANELRHFLGRTFGKEVPVVHRLPAGSFASAADTRAEGDSPTQPKAEVGPPGEGRASSRPRRLVSGKVAIVLGENEWSRSEGLTTADLATDAFRIRVTDDRIYLLGRDDPAKTPVRDGYALSRSTAGACYEFLERYADTRFFFPGELGTCIASRDRIAVPCGDEVCSPVFTERYYREWFHMGPWYEKGVTPHDAHALNRIRLRYGSTRIPACHGQRGFRYTERFAESHPEYFALRKDGTRRNQPRVKDLTKNDKFCYSSAIKEEMYLDARAYLTGAAPATRGLEAWGRNCVGHYVDLMPEDDYVECWCEECQKRYDKKALMYASDFLWQYTADIARRLQDEGVKGDITMMAYAPYRSVPAVDIPSNVQVMVAEHGPWSANDPVGFGEQKREVAAWARKLGHKVWLWTYPGKFSGPGNRDAPQICPRAYARYFREMAPWIFGGYAETDTARFAYDALNVYVYAKLGWNPQLDIEALLEDFHRHMFGAAARPMAAVFDAFEDLWMNGVCGLPATDTPLGPVQPDASSAFLWGTVYTEKSLAPIEQGFAEALAGVAPGSVEARRIEWFRKELLEPLLPHLGEVSVEKELVRRREQQPRNLLGIGAMEDLADWGCEVAGAELALDRDVKVSGAASIRLSTPEPADRTKYLLAQARSRKPVKVEKGGRYRVSYFIRVKDVQPFNYVSAAGQCQGGAGLLLWEGEGWKLYRKMPRPPLPCGTFDWAHQAFEFTAREDTVFFEFRISEATGTMWIDDVLLESL